MNKLASARRRPAFDRLDDRCLPSGIKATLAGGVLRVTGTVRPDTIQVRWVDMPGRGAVGSRIEVAGVGAFPAAKVRSVDIRAGGGDDTIRVAWNGTRSEAPALRIDAASGADRILVTMGPRLSVPLRINAGSGNDTIRAPRGPKVRIDPGSGRTTINGVTKAAAVKPAAKLISTPATPALDDWQRQLIDLTNAERVKRGLAPLRVDARLVGAAQLQADQMARLGRMSHTLADAPLPALADRLRSVGYNGGAGENIAFNYRDPADAVLGWMYSEDHRRNLLDPRFDSIGVAVARDSEGLPYFVQVFGYGA
jgi:uncharacterized protein YkwD